ncbi:kinesin-associated protein 3 [Reticulomyxa filosa]|uniref:Kinesin-associated protein 3 n=1 Tax=Reticulomyxa filosa TaxID=46433 RepID=X6NCD9_RETFI|nr:kinesin-associated protein 3 [Reticulomyxa filosa]|eukprot:ETO22982.1 kinesin-associated protein 3 [Reticulomyxa filosa]
MITQYQKKKVKPGLIELDPNECAILVHIETQYINYDPENKTTPVVVNKSNSYKKIKIEELDKQTNLGNYATQLIEKCKYIHPSKHQQLTNLLTMLKERTQQNKSKIEVCTTTPITPSDENVRQTEIPKAFNDSSLTQEREKEQTSQSTVMQKQAEENRNQLDSRGSKSEKISEELKREKMTESHKRKEKEKLQKRQRRQQLKIEKELSKNKPKDVEKADINNIEKYMECLYEEDNIKRIEATYCILQLLHSNERNITAMIKNQALLSCLSRILQEERKKHTEFITNILEIFFVFSNVSEFSDVLTQYKIGMTSMQIISQECKRYDIMQSQVTAIANENISSIEHVNNESGPTTDKNLPSENMELVIKLLRQEKLLYVCTYILLNLSETSIENELKMVRIDIIKYLIKTLERENPFSELWLIQLFYLSLLFLHKLSLFRENIGSMKQYHLIRHLKRLYTTLCKNSGNENFSIIEAAILQLLLNLSFDNEVKQQLCEWEFPELLYRCIQKNETPTSSKEIGIKILYNISTFAGKEDLRSALSANSTWTEMIIENIIKFPCKFVEENLVALAINLSSVATVHQQWSDPEVLAQLFKKVQRTLDPLLMNLINHLILQSNPITKLKLKKYIHPMCSMLTQSMKRENVCQTSTSLWFYILKTMQCFDNVESLDLKWSDVLIQYGLVQLFMDCLINTNGNITIENDIALHILIITGVFLSDDKCAVHLAQNEQFVQLLIKTVHGTLYIKTYFDRSFLEVVYLFTYHNAC